MLQHIHLHSLIQPALLSTELCGRHCGGHSGYIREQDETPTLVVFTVQIRAGNLCLQRAKS